MRDLHFEPLTPTAFLLRSARVHADRIAVRDDSLTLTYAQLASRALRLAGWLKALGVPHGGRVAVLAPNTRMVFDAHFGIPLAGAVCVPLNIRYGQHELAGIVEHCGADVLLADEQFAAIAHGIARALERPPRLVIACEAPDCDYERQLARAEESATVVDDECGLLSINYTSGTGGQAKGVMFHHRGAYLQTLAVLAHTRLDRHATMLWTLPHFHCHGWSFIWAVTAAGGTHVCVPKVEPERVWQQLDEGGITHLNGAPTVLTLLADAPCAHRLPQPLQVATGGAPPTPALLRRVEQLNLQVTHFYGLTETLGPAALCEWRDEWDALPARERAGMRARQGVGNLVAQPLRVIDARGVDVPADGQSLGEVSMRGNNVMLGYYRDDDGTRRAAPDGWFRTGDVGVMHGDGYVQIMDRVKDVINSGGEKVPSLEVEAVLAEHPAVTDVAVVACPDAIWGEIPVAFVVPSPGAALDEPALIDWARARLSHFKVPRRVIARELPRTATGKIRKDLLRDELRHTFWQAVYQASDQARAEGAAAGRPVPAADSPPEQHSNIPSRRLH